MKKTLFTIFVLLFLYEGMTQEKLFANESHTMTLFFPSPIRQAVTGADNYTFSYNRETAQHFGLLQANKGSESNLLVITQDGQVYSFLLSYRKQLPKSYRFVEIAESIGRESKSIDQHSTSPLKVQSKPLELASGKKDLNMMKKGAEYVLARKSASLKTKRKDGLVFRLKELFYHLDHVYLELEIRNNSLIDFELDALEIYKVNGKNGRRSSYQMLRMKPLYIHSMPNKVRVGEKFSFVQIMPKFTLGDSERLLLELHEKKGNRMLRLYHK